MQTGNLAPAAPVEESRGVAGLGPLPAFELPAVGGVRVRSWDYKSRRHLVLWLAGSAPDPSSLAAAARRVPDLQAEGGELLVICAIPGDLAERLSADSGLAGRILVDTDRRIHTKLGVNQPMLLVVHKDGTIFWRTTLPANRPDLDEALSWLGYINILEPECGSCVPAWPVD